MKAQINREDFLKLAENKIGLKFVKDTTKPGFAMDEAKVLGIGLVGSPGAPRLDRGAYSEVELSDFLPEMVSYGEKATMRVAFYLEYPPLRGIEYRLKDQTKKASKVSYNAVALIGFANLFKEVYGQVHIYIDERSPMPLFIRGRPLTAEYSGFEAYIAPRIAP